MQLNIYDQNLKLQGFIDDATSVIWTRKYHEPGDFEIHCALKNEYIDLLKANNIVSKESAIEAGIIEDIELNQSDFQIIIKGRFLSSLMSKRLIKRTFTFNGTVENAMFDLFEYVLPIPLCQSDTRNGFTDTISFQATYKNLLTYEEKLSKSANIGFRIIPNYNERKMYFQTYKGNDVSKSVEFSTEEGNLINSNYKFNNQIYKTTVYVGGEGEGDSRIYVQVGDTLSDDIREVFVDAKDIRSDKYSTADEYYDALRQRGYDYLNSNSYSESFDCTVSSNSDFTYKSDYDLGDIIKVSNDEWGINLVKRITEIQEVYENGGMQVTLTLGSALADTIDWSE